MCHHVCVGGGGGGGGGACCKIYRVDDDDWCVSLHVCVCICMHFVVYDMGTVTC